MTCNHITETNVSIPNGYQTVYREECVRCFVSQDSESGIDLCLACFESGCGPNEHNHSKTHLDQKQHPIMLNIKRKLKPETCGEPLRKVTKLEIREESEEDIYNWFYQPHCLICKTDLDIQQPLLSASFEAVIKAPKASNKSQVKAWENEIVPCEHTLCLQPQADYIPDLKDTKCFGCDLKDNLWMCLHCGILSCGRKQYGGGGGNGHAIEHFKKFEHAVSAKLKSITPDGHADIYCYSCDEERIDPYIEDHLTTFQIDMKKLNKTEKSLAEMQLEQNLNWDFGTSEEESGATRLFGPGLTGLKNLGNSCYLASTMQALFSVKEFADFELDLFNTCNPSCDRPASNLQCQLSKLAEGLCSGRFSKPSELGRQTTDSSSMLPFQDGLRPYMFKDVIGQDHPEFGTAQQQDAYEFLVYLLGIIRKNSIGNRDISTLFDFEIEQKLLCLSCKRARYSAFTSQGLTIPVPRRKIGEENGEGIYEEVTLNECLDSAIQPDSMDYTCEACKSKQGATTQLSLKTFPKVLALQLNRFDIQAFQVKKLGIPVKVSEEGLYKLDHLLVKSRPEGEELLPEAGLAISWNEQAMEQLQAMGFPLIRCQRAMLATNNADAETAMNWLFEHMEDPTIDNPIDISELKQATKSGTVPDDKVQSLCEFGFPEARATRALLETNNDVERAVDWILNHPDETFEETTSEARGSMEAEKVKYDTNSLPANYQLKAIISHKGGSAHAGHYVAFIRKEIEGQGVWALYNDEKVLKVSSLEEAKATGYVYILERIDN
ncbi:Lys48-specific deubiquitinase Ubp14 [Schizosaccharomyces osmophilus]|uniref:Ubiquitin carboxyl-terminal hydrolase n=1 Tax=Schizosaccharomyces osmophilus TaxID=2545709 RepID=A0AAE9WCD9_9SCHI|nr:Lys48-specific deubiquitinase Ubp14 [Schizosaccharomyces osmophilus]WBW72612.1 Lys48-specific deubiquitinase Ubp14 [Schizosaccharomyces osmophilus]